MPLDEENGDLTLEDGGEEYPQEWQNDDDSLEGDHEEAAEAEMTGEPRAEDAAAAEDDAEDASFFDGEELEDVFPGIEPEDQPLFSEPELPEEEFLSEPELPEEKFPAEAPDPSSADFEDAPSELPADQDAQEPAEDTGLSKDSILGLMNYLKSLAGTLPEKKKESFMNSDVRFSMEHVIDTLEGNKGLPPKHAAKVPLRPGSAGASMGGEKIAGTPSYLKNLHSPIPDKNLFSILRQKVQSIMARIKAVTDKRKKNAE
ncbi:MAG: hypothetical protein LBP60_08965 [Spirochaetaceae bacterium]|jgi:hypothetical protein|nr:hypothetical protein [Spirochaetaceae bacterium]